MKKLVSIDMGDSGVRAQWISILEQMCRQEGLEATTTRDRCEMWAYDMGFQGVVLTPWFKALCAYYSVDWKKEWEMGRRAR